MMLFVQTVPISDACLLLPGLEKTSGLITPTLVWYGMDVWCAGDGDVVVTPSCVSRETEALQVTD